jgi:DNA polymerase delta subunit 4
MPPTRKTPGTHAAGPGKQSKLSFAHRVTKPSAKVVGKDLNAGAPSPLSKQVFPEKAAPAPVKEEAPEAEVVKDEQEEEEEEEPQSTIAPPAPVKTDAELEAEKISDVQVGRYWRAVEAQRLAPRVHQEDLDVSEKVLRYFDVSSQYGVSVISMALIPSLFDRPR